jgi:5-methylcytosine-specific restriction protein B
MSVNNQFDWISFYEEFADKLLEYKNDRKALIEKVIKIYDITGINMPKLEMDNNIIDIDPFTVFALFNKQISFNNRIKIITEIKNIFKIKAEVPSSYDGIPVVNNLKATFYGFVDDRNENDIENIWNLFSSAIKLASDDNSENRNSFIKNYNLVSKQICIRWNITMGLFWMRPSRYLNLDSRNRWFIGGNDSLPENFVLEVKKLKSPPVAEEYLKICDECLRYIASESSTFKSIPDLSYNAWLVSKQDDEYEDITDKGTSTSTAKFLQWFKPLLQALRDLGGSATPKEAREKIKENEKLSEEETERTRGKTNTSQFDNDVAWARQYLVRAGYIDNSVHGIWKLTDVGWSVEMTDELATEIFRKVVKENQIARNSKGSALADEDVETKHYWIYSPGSGASKWNEFYDKGIMAIGWGEIGDLNIFHSKSEMKIAMKEAFNPNLPYTHDALATWQFANEMKVGDVVFAKKGRDTIIGRGVIESDYEFDNSVEDEFKNIRRVKWTNNGEWEHPGKAGVKTLTDITSYTEYVELLNALFENDSTDYEEEEKDYKPIEYDRTNFLEDVYISVDSYDTLVGLLKNKMNVILQGAPGVGKTYMAKRLAYSIMGVKDPERVHLVQFHQSYTYEDFVEGFRPSSTGLNFEIKKGAFYTFCKKASDDSENDYFFIIDEINRGNLSKIFGELFMLIEKDKRGNDIQLLYSSDKFSVPKNVYIIGMMNTADRSLAILDYALRRRFAFYDMKPAFDSDGFKKYKNNLDNEKFNKLIDCIKNINKTIADDESLGEGFCIGHSYFCDLERVDEQTLSNIVEYEIIPLLKEYWFDEPSKIREWSENLRSAIK